METHEIDLPSPPPQTTVPSKFTELIDSPRIPAAPVPVEKSLPSPPATLAEIPLSPPASISEIVAHEAAQDSKAWSEEVTPTPVEDGEVRSRDVAEAVVAAAAAAGTPTSP